MLDKVIHKHLDVMDEIEESMHKDIKKIIDGIDIKLIMNNPYNEMINIVYMIKKKLLDDHIPKAIQAGFKFSKDIKKDGEIVVTQSNNPTLNEIIVK